MSRAQRLLDLIQILRRHRRPVAGGALAAELGVSLRTLYRDIATLQAQGAHIEGEPGVGYLLRPGFMLPPLMFSEEEIEALVLGSRWVSERGDAPLAAAARNAIAKIAAVLPDELRERLDATTLLVPATGAAVIGDAELATIRAAIRAERKLIIAYRDSAERTTRRTIWPFAVGYFERVRVVAAWCELRQDFRSFRTDRIAELTATTTRYARRRQALLKEWRVREGIREP
ncbi:MAG TPA: YafY family protein [Xanthobacteraceae bacterium]|nr:YafY family protein [Xanthobacteraceae bacterium]